MRGTIPDARYLKSTVTNVLLQWPHFFIDLLQSIQSGHPWTVDLYLRILLAIDSEVVDRLIIHTQEVCFVVSDMLLCEFHEINRYMHVCITIKISVSQLLV